MRITINKPFLMKALAFAALAILTLWLRLRELGHNQMGYDQSSMIGIAMSWLNGGSLPLTSVKTSIGIFHPPLVEYLLALPLAFTRDLLGIVWLITLINLAGVAAAGWATARVFGWRVAWWASLLFAVNPWAAYYARFIWSQSFVPGFSALAYACLLPYLTTDRRPWLLVAGIVALAAAVQVHLTTALVVIALIPVFIALRQRISIPHLLIGAGIAALTFVPYLLFQINTGYADVNVLLAGDGQPAQLNFDSVIYSLDLFVSRGIFATIGTESEAPWQALNPGWPEADVLVTVALAAALVASLAFVVIEWRRARDVKSLGHQAAAELMMLSWLIVPVALLLRHSQHMQNYYFVYLYPIPLVLLARLADRAYVWLEAHAAPGRWPPVGRALIGCIAFVPLALIGAQQTRLDVTGQDLMASGTASRVRVVDVKQAIAITGDLMAARPGCSLVIVSNAPSIEFSNYGLLREAITPTPVRFVEAGYGMLIPANCAAYFSITENRRAVEWLDENTQPQPFTSTALSTQLWRFDDLPEADRDAAAAKWVTEEPLADWGMIKLWKAEAPDIRTPGQNLPLIATWEVIAPDAARPQIHWGNYVLTADNQVVAQIDGPGVDSREWRAGDLFETVFRITLPPDIPPGEYRLASVLYVIPSLERLTLTDGADMVIWGTVTIISP